MVNVKSIEELKAIAYDLIASREEISRRLQIINQAINQEMAKDSEKEKPKNIVKSKKL